VRYQKFRTLLRSEKIETLCKVDTNHARLQLHYMYCRQFALLALGRPAYRGSSVELGQTSNLSPVQLCRPWYSVCVFVPGSSPHRVAGMSDLRGSIAASCCQPCLFKHVASSVTRQPDNHARGRSSSRPHVKPEVR
jgi:hypothetical protein